jgi:hypothetical protein
MTIFVAFSGEHGTMLYRIGGNMGYRSNRHVVAGNADLKGRKSLRCRCGCCMIYDFRDLYRKEVIDHEEIPSPDWSRSIDYIDLDPWAETQNYFDNRNNDNRSIQNG